MPSTYSQIASTTVSGTSTSTITFGSLANTYTDLIIIYNGKTNAAANMYLRFNSDATTAYSVTRLLGSGTAASSDRATSANQIDVNVSTSTSDGINEIFHIQNYSNSSTYKTVLTRWNNASSYVAAIAGSWRNTAAITQIDIILSTSYFVAGSTFSLYGIKAA